MKKISFVITFILISVFCAAQDDINYFEVSNNIAKPVKIRTNMGSFLIYGGETITGHITWMEVYDANGNKIVQNTPYKYETATNKPTKRWYRI